MSGWLLLAAAVVAAAIVWLIYLDWRASRFREEEIGRADRAGAHTRLPRGPSRRPAPPEAEAEREIRPHRPELAVRRTVSDFELSSETFFPPEVRESEEVGQSEVRMGPAVPGWEHPIPWSYNETRLVLLVRDPYWLFSYWELTDEVHRAAEERVGREAWFQARPVLRVYDVTAGSHYDLAVDETARNWYVNVGLPDRTWYMEIGRITEDGEFVMLARSNRVHTPRDMASDVIDPRWPPLHYRYQVAGFWPEGMPGSPGMPGSAGTPAGAENPWRSAQ